MPSQWRPVLRQIVSRLADGDYQLERSVDHVGPISDRLAKQMKDFVKDYGETLILVPTASWQTSIAQ